jgi:flagellar basal body rod protein FlgC
MLDDIIKKIIREATSTSTGSRGSYIAPLMPGIREFGKDQNQPFTTKVSKYDSPFLEYDSYDGSMETPKKQIKKIEKEAKKVTDYIKYHPNSTISDDEGNVINQTPGKNKNVVPLKEWVDLESINLNEISTSTSAGGYNGPIGIGLKKWKKSELDPFTKFADTEFNHSKKQKTLKDNVKGYVGHWEKNKDGSYKLDNHDTHTINEDLAVWFGTKKKPKGSKQPKGPWVNICRKVDGKHPPCGRPDADSKGYPKCRAVGVAGKMSDSAKKSACQQKRTAEKKDTQTGKGQKPVMTHYEPKKKKTQNESLDILVKRILDNI